MIRAGFPYSVFAIYQGGTPARSGIGAGDARGQRDGHGRHEELEEKAALQTLKLLDKLEELDEVQHVSSNVDFSYSILEKYQLRV